MGSSRPYRGFLRRASANLIYLISLKIENGGGFIMEWMWLLYWGLLLFIFIFGMNVAIKKNKLTGAIQGILSVILPIWAFIFALKRDYLSSGPESNELYFMYTKIMNGDIEAISITLLFIILMLVFIYNILLFKKH